MEFGEYFKNKIPSNLMHFVIESQTKTNSIDGVDKLDLVFSGRISHVKHEEKWNIKNVSANHMKTHCGVNEQWALACGCAEATESNFDRSSRWNLSEAVKPVRALEAPLKTFSPAQLVKRNDFLWIPLKCHRCTH